MRFLTWNCQGAFRNKHHLLDRFEADVLIIQECERPERRHGRYHDWAGNHLWSGGRGSRGIGIFARQGLELDHLHWPDNGASLFLPFKVNQAHQIVSVWTQHAKRARDSYVGQVWNYLELNRSRFDGDTILCGDFNSNTIWDRPNRYWSHSKCVAVLAELGMSSLYHHFHCETQGQETRPTFFMQRNLQKPFHIDHVFVQNRLLEAGKPTYWLGEPDNWLSFSDHMPLVFDI